MVVYLKEKMSVLDKLNLGMCYIAVNPQGNVTELALYIK